MLGSFEHNKLFFPYALLGWLLHKIIISVSFDHEFFDSVPHQRIRHLLKSKPLPMQSSEEIQKLTMPFFTSPEDSLAHLIAKGMPSQMPYVT